VVWVVRRLGVGGYPGLGERLHCTLKVHCRPCGMGTGMNESTCRGPAGGGGACGLRLARSTLGPRLCASAGAAGRTSECAAAAYRARVFAAAASPWWWREAAAAAALAGVGGGPVTGDRRRRAGADHPFFPNARQMRADQGAGISPERPRPGGGGSRSRLRPTRSLSLADCRLSTNLHPPCNLLLVRT
jgi:hypothetical protein